MDKYYKTDQESFWANEFGNQYIERNVGDFLLASNLSFFSRALKNAVNIKSCIEFGANVGMNLRALKLLYPNLDLTGIEINHKAANILKSFIGEKKVINDTIFNVEFESKFDVSLIKGVLIHIKPDMLQLVYEKLYLSSSKYILIAEYYNPSPVEISYRGHDDKLFKRDFAGEIMDKYPDLQLIDYGFVYKRDNSFPQDDITWFLLKK